jgi:histidinol-phosphate phosphatase family protein
MNETNNDKSSEFPNSPFRGLGGELVNSQWTLFLDRDGVINYEKPGDYVYNWNEFIFYEGVTEAIKTLTQIFGLIIMVTNQRGIGKELMTVQDLQDIHINMLRAIEAADGSIDRIYYCSSTADDDPLRKPNPGMALLAKKDYPQIDLSKSIMVGNNISDMEFGRNAGMHTVFLRTTHPGQELPHPAIDLAFDTLADFAKAFQK